MEREYSIPILLFLLSLVVFNIKFRYVESGDTAPNELLPISIMSEYDLDFNEFIQVPYQFTHSDGSVTMFIPEGDELPYWFRNINGRIVSTYPIIPGILNLPIYFLASLVGVNLLENRYALSMLSSSIISSLSVVFMYLCLTKVCRRQHTALFFALIYAFATCVWSVACRAIWQHGPSLLFLTVSLFMLFSGINKLIPYTGFFLGMAVFNRPANIVIALLLTLYIFSHHKDEFVKYLALAAIPAVLLAWYSHTYLGSIMSLGQAHNSLNMFSGRILPGLAGLLISPSRGLFVFSPIFIFSFAYLFRMLLSKETQSIYRDLAISVISSLLSHSKWGMWWGGHSFGYRLLIELIPVLVVFGALCWERLILNHWPLRAIFLGCVLISVFVHFLGAFYYPCGFNRFPNDIDAHPERLWRVWDTEITRCTIRLLADLWSMISGSAR